MIVNPDILRKELVRLLSEIDMQIKEVKQAAEKANCRPEELVDDHGSWPMIPLLSAQVQAISALAQLNEYGSKK